MRLQRHKMGADDFEPLTMIGKGAFGEQKQIYLQKLAVIALDIKPDNLLLDKFWHMKLSDFGLCKPLDCTNLQEKDFTAAKNLSGALQSDGRPVVPRRTQQEQLQHWQRNRRMLVHPWFKGIEWEKLYQMEVVFIPKVNGELDTQNFEKFEEVTS
ncbi:putative protein kinase AGC-NDR family [Helianthus annuus]|nr:putative protein kinase AGC-NDR family [Helianthus annuus]KAJ0723097.1 putative protein kinase AGC-NDR family [Helianthus annuus]